MQTLVFNTTTKVVKLYEGKDEESQILYTFYDCPTVKHLGDTGYYEVMQKNDDKTTPVLRVPISQTNMLISK